MVESIVKVFRYKHHFDRIRKVVLQQEGLTFVSLSVAKQVVAVLFKEELHTFWLHLVQSKHINATEPVLVYKCSAGPDLGGLLLVDQQQMQPVRDFCSFNPQSCAQSLGVTQSHSTVTKR